MHLTYGDSCHVGQRDPITCPEPTQDGVLPCRHVPLLRPHTIVLIVGFLQPNLTSARRVSRTPRPYETSHAPSVEAASLPDCRNRRFFVDPCWGRRKSDQSRLPCSYTRAVSKFPREHTTWTLPATIIACFTVANTAPRRSPSPPHANFAIPLHSPPPVASVRRVVHGTSDLKT